MGKFCKQIVISKGKDFCICRNLNGRSHNLYGPASVSFYNHESNIYIRSVGYYIDNRLTIVNKGGPSYFLLNKGKVQDVYWDYSSMKYIYKTYHNDGSISTITTGWAKANHFVKGVLHDKVQKHYNNIVIPQIKVLFEKADIRGNIIGE